MIGRPRIGLLCGLAIATLSVGWSLQDPDPEPAALWLSEVDAGMRAAESSGKPLLIVFRCVP